MTVEGWLLDSDPAIRWQVMRDLTAYFEMEDGEGKPNRWNTLRAMRALRWAAGSAQPSMASEARS